MTTITRTVPEAEDRVASAVAVTVDPAGVTTDGHELYGYVARWDEENTIRDLDGDFTEVVRRGAFRRTLAERTPTLLWEHGKGHLGNLPIGRLDVAEEDDVGLYVLGRIFRNAAVEPIREALAERALSGMSMRFSAKRDGSDRWPSRDYRELLDVDVPEVSVVTFAAYSGATANVRGHPSRPKAGGMHLPPGGTSTAGASPARGTASTLDADLMRAVFNTLSQQVDELRLRR